QWHLNNTGQLVGDPVLQDIYGVPGEDANVFGAWALGYTGQGVTVAVVDTGVQVDHPDLAANISTTLGYDAVLDAELGDFPDLPGFPHPGEADQTDPNNAHGTAAAGLIGAVGNNGIGGAGVAYNSTLVPIQVIDGGDFFALVRALQYANNEIDIYNLSLGAALNARVVDGINGPGNPILDALRNSATTGRNGLGNINVLASGNDAGPSFISPFFTDTGYWDYAGYSGLINSPYTIGVTGVDHDGLYRNVDGTYTSYPEASASVLIAAPTGSNVQEVGNDSVVGSGLLTTDFYNPNFDPNNPVYDPASPLYNPLTPTLEGYNGPSVGNQEPFDGTYDRFDDPAYTSRFNGTSAADPIVSGVIALMLEANPNLTYRDVENILVRSARQNAQFEDMGDGFTLGTLGFALDNTWVTNPNEFFHVSDILVRQNTLLGGISELDALYQRNGTIDLLDLFDDNRTDYATDYIDSAVGSAFTVTYNPQINPVPALLGPAEDTGPVIFTNTMDPDLFTNGAGFTVSLGRGLYGTGVGFGHGVVDAELAVKLAEQYTEYLPQELTWTTGKQQPAALPIDGEEVGDQAATFLVVPGRIEASGLLSAISPAFSEAPDFPAANTFDAGYDFYPIVVPETLTTNPQEGYNSNMVVEWVELRLSLTDGDLDETRITLVSPSGTHSELVNYFDLDDGTRSYQYDIAADLVGPPPGTLDAAEWTFSTNRHWGEKSANAIAIDPATGEPYESFSGAMERSWQVHIESFGAGNNIQDFELIFHGSPLDPATKRIQGFVGVDEFRQDSRDSDGDFDFNEVVKDGYFNFDRYIQFAQDIYNPTNIVPEQDNLLENAIFSRLNIPGINADNSTTAVIQVEDPLNPGTFIPALVDIASESLANGQVDFNRLGEIERVVDTTQEQFAENVAVQLFREISDGFGGSVIEAAPYRTFITGDDGNYYFDVVPPVDSAAAGQGDVVAYVVRVVDGEGREVVQADTNAPVGPDANGNFFLPKYKGEWRITDDYFFAWDHQGRTPEFVTTLDPVSGLDANVVRIVDQTGADSLMDANGSLLTAAVTNLGSNGQDITFVDQNGAAVTAYDMNGNPLLTDANGAPAVIVNWDPSRTGDNAQQFILLNVTPGDTTGGLMLSNGVNGSGHYDFVFIAPNSLLGTPVDPNNPLLGITLNPDGTHTIIETPPMGMPGDPMDVNGMFIVYDQNNELVTFEVDLGGNTYPVSRTNIRTDVLFSPEMDIYDLASSAGFFGGFSGFGFGSGYTYDPAAVYDILADANGDPLPYTLGLFGAPVEDDVRGINFLLDSGAAPSVTGRVFTDVNGDGLYNPAVGDVAKVDALVYIDVDHNGEFQPSIDLGTLTDSDGLYTLDVSLLTSNPQMIEVAVVGQDGFDLVTPAEGTYNLLREEVGSSPLNFVFEVSNGGIPDPTGQSGIMGQVFNDLDGDGVRDFNEEGYGGITVYIDADGNGSLDSGEMQTVTNTGGFYEFTGLAEGPTNVAIIVNSPLVQTAPQGGAPQVVNVIGGVVAVNVLFGVQSLATRDYGDLGTVGNVTYATTIAQGGPSHAVVPTVKLGKVVDGEFDGQPDEDATGDNLAGLIDEDGVTLVAAGLDTWIDPGDTLTFEIEVAGVGFLLNAWLDFNGDGDFDDDGEHVYVNEDLNPGVWLSGVTRDKTGAIALPNVVAPISTTTTGPIGARFRWGEGDLLPTGDASIGEVEDYLYNDSSTTQQTVLPGDYDGSGLVDQADYAVWVSSYGLTGAALAADGNGDGFVNAADYTVWR
ncbi:MAG: S8 family serine peptidase, partial [Planctomycetales bacterium]|nr:S8 family serine peptidase [Planctomycetales bacterium]